MLSKWAFGFWQCKNRYTSAAEVTTAVSTYRTRNIPLDQPEDHGTCVVCGKPATKKVYFARAY